MEFPFWLLWGYLANVKSLLSLLVGSWRGDRGGAVPLVSSPQESQWVTTKSWMVGKSGRAFGEYARSEKPVHWGCAERVQRQILLGTRVGLLWDSRDFPCQQEKIPWPDLGRLPAMVNDQVIDSYVWSLLIKELVQMQSEEACQHRLLLTKPFQKFLYLRLRRIEHYFCFHYGLMSWSNDIIPWST